MSKEVKRYGMCGFESGIVEMEDGPYVHAADYDALLAERDARLLQVDTLTDWYSHSLEVINEVMTALPGVYYMDTPDGGDVSIPEQVRRMAKDADRYRWLREQKAEDGMAILPICKWVKPAMLITTPFDSPEMVDSVIDAALQGAKP